MKTKILAMVFLAGGSMFAQSRLSIGVGIGGYGPGYYAGYPSVQAIVPPCPGPDYNWVEGYWSPYGGRSTWVSGYWAKRPYIGEYRGGYRVGPRFVQPGYGNRFGNAYRPGSVSRSFRGREYGRSYHDGFRGR